MKELVVISGKGGTGKTSIVASFAALATRCVIADCDVDAADLHLVLNPTIIHKESFISGAEPVIDTALCTQCGLCRELCRYEAIEEDFTINSFNCEGCGVCADNCPESAITMKAKNCGDWFTSATRYGPMVHARLGIAEENSGRLVTLVRKKAREEAEKEGERVSLLIVDGSPGIGCPVIASIGGCDMVLVVSEPTVSGLHDSARVIELTEHFKIPASMVINKSDLNDSMTQLLRELCLEKNVPLLGEIPYDDDFTFAMLKKRSIVEYSQGEASQKIGELWAKIIDKLSNEEKGDS